MALVFRNLCSVALLAAACAPSFAAPLDGIEELQRNGGASRHLWTPAFTRADVAGMHLSAGIALGLRNSVQSQLRRNVTPALSLDLGSDAKLSILHAGARGAMLVLHSTR